MIGVCESSGLFGIDGKKVIVEADFGDGLPSFDMVGLLSNEVREARERVRSALKNSNIFLPPGKLTVNLSPADLRKIGNCFDLPIAVAILIALGTVPQENVLPFSFIGELSLKGELRAIGGTLSHVIQAKETGKKGCILPKENAREGTVIRGIPIYGFSTLNEVIEFLISPSEEAREPEFSASESGTHSFSGDFSEIFGQESVKRAAEVACSGMHGMLLIGPPGSGKTLTARRIPSILPPLTEEERIESSKIHSVAGILDKSKGLLYERPFRAPHHTISANALVGGGITPHSGEMSLAHNGVLFLDELPEFSKLTLEVMRQPLEDKKVTISRTSGSYVFPTRVMLVCAMNPCRCGYYPDRNKCHCSEADVRHYLERISKPLLDRIDITVEAPRVGIDDLRKETAPESSEEIRKRVLRAWEIQKERYKGKQIVFNSQLEGSGVREFCRLKKDGIDLMREVFDRMDLSARAHDRILKVARTIADLSGEEDISTAHLSEAVLYRSLDRKFWRS